MLDKDLAGILKVSPFFVKDYKTAMRNYSEKQLEHIFHLLQTYDLRFKGVNNYSVKEGELLRELIAQILN